MCLKTEKQLKLWKRPLNLVSDRPVFLFYAPKILQVFLPITLLHPIKFKLYGNAILQRRGSLSLNRSSIYHLIREMVYTLARFPYKQLVIHVGLVRD